MRTLETITNITDMPKKGSIPRIIEVHKVPIQPGQTLQIAKDMITDKVLDLQKAGYIIIGTLPQFYKDFKNPPQKTQFERISERLKNDAMGKELDKAVTTVEKAK